MNTSSVGERLHNRMDEIDETQQNISPTVHILHSSSPVTFEQIMIEESIGDELVLDEIDIQLVSHPPSPPPLPPRIPAMVELETSNQHNSAGVSMLSQPDLRNPNVHLP